MTDDKIAKDTARDPEREALGRLRGGIRAAAKKAVRKVTKKAAQKKTAKKAAAAAGTTTAAAAKTTARGAGSAKRADKTAPASAGAPASRGAVARSPAAKRGAAPARAATARASDSAADTPAAAAARPHEPEPSFETPRPRAPIHPGAALDSMQEHAGGLGSLLALWGPLIMVGFLVLVFRGGDEGESTVATGAGVQGAPAADSTVEMARGSAPSGAARGPAQAFDGGFAMRTSMAGPSVFAGRGPGAGVPAVASARLYPSPSGPYTDPRYRGLPTGESWSAEGQASLQHKDGGDAPVQWVRCAAPYYWCPAPSSPAW